MRMQTCITYICNLQSKLLLQLRSMYPGMQMATYLHYNEMYNSIED